MAPMKDLDGVWGKPTSTLDWCEVNYVVTPYIAEFWNTVSSLVLVFIPVLDLVYTKLTAPKWVHMEWRNYMACLAFISVGLGSLLFHMSLLYESQLLDELPMIWGTCVLVYLFFENNSKPSSQSYALVLFLILYSSAVTAIYILVINPIFHQIAFMFLVTAAFGRGAYCFFYLKMDCSPVLFFLSVLLFFCGGVLWLLDNGLCTHLRHIRSVVPAPLGAGLQLHAWWHVLAGLGAHCQFMFSYQSRLRYLKHHTTEWVGWFPLVTIGGKENGHIN
ncbi:alkaline ceramidase 3-like [Patiria miniata]|uniref:Alkaline ceramidase n=1 Tax=Patiria miniata TaxID=46514 RepID=A0A913ZHQ3_PATMI|nr:alkaline ceramidase 3-like [Patiria miniata]